MVRKAYFTLVFFAATLAYAFADQISLRNGDRITGNIISSDAQTQTLNILTPFAGKISIQWGAIQGVSSTQPLYVKTKSGQVLVGALSSNGDTIGIETADAGTVTVAMDAVTSIRSKDEEAKAETEETLIVKKKLDETQKELDKKANEVNHMHPSLKDNWTGTIDTGFNLVRGNASTTAFGLSSNAVRRTDRDLVYMTATSLWTNSRGPGVTASFLRGSILYDVNIKEKPFAFVQLDLEHDEMADVVFRAVSAIGLGYHTIQSGNARTFDLMTGVGIDQFFLNRRDVRYGDAAGPGHVVVGDKLSFEIAANTNLTQDLRFYAYFNSSGYRIAFDTAIHTNLNKWLNWHFTVGDRFWSNPPVGFQRNDLVVLTGLGLTFGGQGEKK